jgi:HEAT repeat protein
MRPDNEFRRKLDALVRGVAPDGRAQAEALIASAVDAGATSEEALIDMAHDQNLNPQLRSSICWMVPRLELATAENILKSLINDRSEQVREEAAAGLGLISKGEAVEVLLNVLQQDSSKAVRLAALHALGVLSSPQSAANVMKVLQSPEEDAEVRADAAESLAHIKNPRIVDVLIDALQDSSSLVRFSAAYALGEQGDTRAIPRLRDVARRDHATTPWGSVSSRALESIETITNQN